VRLYSVHVGRCVRCQRWIDRSLVVVVVVVVRLFVRSFVRWSFCCSSFVVRRWLFVAAEHRRRRCRRCRRCRCRCRCDGNAVGVWRLWLVVVDVVVGVGATILVKIVSVRLFARQVDHALLGLEPLSLARTCHLRVEVLLLQVENSHALLLKCMRDCVSST